VRAITCGLTLATFLSTPPTLAAGERFDVPGGAAALRSAAGLPTHVPDSMLLVEAARAWYGARIPLSPGDAPAGRLVAHLKATNASAEPGPLALLPVTTWTALLAPAPGQPLAAALAANRAAMLLYHGLAGACDATLEWLISKPDLLRELLDNGAPAFAFAAPAIHLEDGAIVLPGGAAMRGAWEDLVGAKAGETDAFIRRLMRRDGGRLAWLFSVLAALDEPRLRFAAGPRGEHLPALSRHFARISREWLLVDRPFWRPVFDPALVLLLIDIPPDGRPRGGPDFWREVFRTEDLDTWRTSVDRPLQSPDLLDVIFSEPYHARERWQVFALGQRLLGTRPADAIVGLTLRGAVRHPALALMLERVGPVTLTRQLALHRAAVRLAARDGATPGGPLTRWQAALALVERASLTGGFTPVETHAALAELASLDPRDMSAALTDWLLDTLVPRLLARPGAPPSPERALLETMAGTLQTDGPRRQPVFAWEDLSYALAGPEASVRRMERARAAQRTPSLDAAAGAWRSGDRQRRRDAERSIGELLLALAYAPLLAAGDQPTLGADVALRHELAAPLDTMATRRRRPWTIAVARSRAPLGWHLEGSLLGLDLAVPDWYLRRAEELPAAAPLLDDTDGASLALLPALALSAPHIAEELEAALRSLDAGRRLAAGHTTVAALDAALAGAGIDPWRRRALRAGQTSVAAIAGQLSLAEFWRLGSAEGEFTVRLPLDGCACLGSAPPAPWLLDGRRTSGFIGAVAPDLVLRIALYLRENDLPGDLIGHILARAVLDVMHGIDAVRTDDRRALALAGAALSDARLEEHLLALIGHGVLARPPDTR
jgi:hypothetical protein